MTKTYTKTFNNKFHMRNYLNKMKENEKIDISRICPDKSDIKVTISLGVAQYKGDDDFVRCADDALYEAKKSGRNKVCINDENL